MKKLLLLVAAITSLSASAQSVLESSRQINQTISHSSLSSNLNKTTSCSQDTVLLAINKASGLSALNINNVTSATALAQYFDAPQAITISGASFYAWKADATGGTSLNATVQIFAAGIDSLPTGSALATATVAVDTNFYTGTLTDLEKIANFTTPVTTSNPYVVVVSNNSPNSMSLISNSYTAADGVQEWLSSVLIGTTWLHSYDVNVGGTPYDADVLIEPYVTYTIGADFVADNPCFASGNLVNFTNASSPVFGNRMYDLAEFLGLPELSFTWDYGDASPVENLVDGSHTYASAGPYNIHLTDTLYTWTSTCVTDTTIAIGQLPTANFNSVSSTLTAVFTNASTASTSATYSWDFGDGNTSTLTSPTHTYATGGTYTVCLTVTDACGTDQYCVPVTVTTGCTNPVPNFSSNATLLTVDFTDMSVTTGSTVSYLYDFGDGNTSTSQNANHTYAANGTYTVCLTVTDSCGTDSTCQSVTVVCPAPMPNFTVSGTEPSFTFTNTSTVTGSTPTYAWDFGDGNTSSVESPSHTYTANGTYTVTLVVVDDCGTTTTTQTVTVNVIGLDDFEFENKLTVYPNPSSGNFTVKSGLNMTSVRVYDLAGKLLMTKSINSIEGSVDLNNLANGQYILSVEMDNGSSSNARVEIQK